jgi:hypothetical protein
MGMLREILTIALRALRSHKMRSMLTMLGPDDRCRGRHPAHLVRAGRLELGQRGDRAGGLEAIALAGLGGLVGVVSGVGLIVLTKLLVPLLGPSGFLRSFDPVPAAPPIIVAFAVSLVIGLVAGGYPAWRAAQLNPVEALRYE